MNRRTGRLILQAMTVAAFAFLAIEGDMLWFSLLWLLALGFTVAELGVIIRFGHGGLWRST